MPTHLTPGGGQRGGDGVHVDDKSRVRKFDRTKVLLDTDVQLFPFAVIEAGDSKPASATVRQQWRYGKFGPAEDTREERTLLVFAANRAINLYMVYHDLIR
jgi:hypothetical protein